MHFKENLPDNIIIVTQEEFLAIFTFIVYHTYCSHKINNLFGCSVEKIAPRLMAPVAIDPFQLELSFGSTFVCHFPYKCV